MSHSLLTIGMLTTGETLTFAVAIVGIVLSAVVTVWIYFEGQREKDRNERRTARHNELKAEQNHTREILAREIKGMTTLLENSMVSLTRRLDDQAEVLKGQGVKIDHFEKTVNGIDRRVAILEERDKANRRPAEKASS